MDTLEHRWQTRQGEGRSKHERKYVDFIVSGRPLSEVFQTVDMDMVSMLGWISNVGYETRIVQELLKDVPAELKTGRTILYGCPQCGDIDCGAITAEILDLGDRIVWRNFGHETNYSGIDFEGYEHFEQFEFDKAQYESEFERISMELANTPRTED